MSLLVTSLERVFKFKNGCAEIVLNDPNPEMSPDEVMNFFFRQLSRIDDGNRSRSRSRKRQGCL